jgi:mannose-6-phosphate isomerase-like protein (cupin superfamily)
MTPRNAYRTILGLCFVLLFGVAVAQQNLQRAQPKSLSAGPPGWRLTADDTLGAFSFGERIAQPGAAGPEPHRHSREDELWYVLEGQLEFRIGDRGEQVIVAGPGATVFGPRGIPHTFKAVGMTPARYVIFVSPAGLEKFFAERTALGKEIRTTDPSYASRYKALTDKYGLEYSSDWSFSPSARN